MALHVIYFRYPDGHLTLAPYSECPTPDDAIREEANTLPEIDRLQKQLVQQEYERCEAEAEANESLARAGKQRVYDSLYSKLVSTATTEYERDFIREYLKLREEKRAKYHSRFQLDRAYLWARENDVGKRKHESEEKVLLDRINF